MQILGEVILGILSVGLAIWGILLVSGRGYRTIAGNRKSTDEQVEAQKRDGLGRAIGGILIAAAVFCAAEAVAMCL